MTNKPKILVVDDERASAGAVARTLRKDFDVTMAYDGLSALNILRSGKFSVIISDQRMPRMTGIEFFKNCVDVQEESIRILFTGYSDLEAVIEAVNNGKIFYYISKPWEPEELKIIVRQAVEKYNLVQENKNLVHQLEIANKTLADENVILHNELERQFHFDNIIGQSNEMKKIFSLMNKIVPTDISVLISGETGTGKELVARAIHYNGPRKEKPFIAENCAALSDTLLESKLFGHRKGAFTGAVKDQKGVFELADEGTVFLDEIGDTSAEFQKRLLRVLQEGEFSPLGSETIVKVDVRMITATNKDLNEEMAQGRFRKDLFYRLNVMPVRLPALRERRQDIELLASFFIKKYTVIMGMPLLKISPSALQILKNYDYPGNVRELENIIQRAVMLSDEKTGILEDMLVMDERSFENTAAKHAVYGSADFNLKIEVENLEKRIIIQFLKEEKGNISRVAMKTGLSRVGLHKKLNRYHIRSDEYKY